MKILHIITGLDFGGAERLLVNFTKYQVLNHTIEIVYFKGSPRLKDEFHPSIKIHHIRLDYKVLSQVRRLIKHIQPDIVHTHLGHSDLIGLWACRGLNVKLFCTMHNIWFKWNYKDYLIFTLYYFLFKTVASKCKVVCISEVVAKHATNTLGVKKENVKVLYNGVPSIEIDKNKNEIRQTLNISSSDFVTLFVGRLEKQKSVHILLLAAAELKNKIPNIKVIILGDGSLAEDLKKLSQKLEIETLVEFRGVTKNSELYFAASDLFVLPSIFEGIPLVILEAFRANLPIVASNIEGTRELINNEINGWLFPVEDHKKLAELILQMHKNTEIRIKIGKSGYESFKNKFDIVNYAKQLELLYLS